MARFAWLLLLVLVGGCEIPPRYIESSKSVDHYLVRRQFRSACVGLQMDDPDLRQYAARKLAEFPEEEEANTCLCEALYRPGAFDVAVASGLAATRRDDLAGCLAPALLDSEIEDRVALVRSLAGIAASTGYAALADTAKGDADPAVRAAATTRIRPADAHVPVVIGLLGEDRDPAVRAAAAEALKGRDSPEVVAALVRAVQEDVDGGVRAAALGGMAKLGHPETLEAACQALMTDPDARMREAAAKAFHGTRRPEAIACLRERLLTHEESGAVRVATVAALGASPRDEAADVLCEAIGPVLRLYVTAEIPAQDIPGADIAKAQNDRDWERSKPCVQRALQQGGYSCYARNYLGFWYRELGGKASMPWCPGMRKLQPEIEL
ncbi:MAG: HEAT repeat domain-containing protein [Deltaproteobacteria bacterium]|nr:HEAT repeat domain-containing protein [Deltaproteobacteria bacterium]MBW2253524.1 HEAT repeat domain-containing protein [Deltaproteobacteria bacterium]